MSFEMWRTISESQLGQFLVFNETWNDPEGILLLHFFHSRERTVLQNSFPEKSRL